MKILGIETAVDETAAAIVEDGHRILGSAVSSQVDLHAGYGGVVPEIAARDHLRQIIPMIKTTLQESNLSTSEIDTLAVSTTPGLLIALLIGIETIKALSYVFDKPVVAVNDLESHAYAVFLENKDLLKKMSSRESWPLLYLIVSGGTTALVYARFFGDFQIVGQTRDDAAGEAFDKIAKLLGLGYPGGPAIQKIAENGNATAFNFPRPMIEEKNHDFSFSGLKTAVLYKLQSLQKLQAKKIADLAASFQQAVVETLLAKTSAAASKLKVKAVVVGGGVAANTPLREAFSTRLNVPVYFPPKSLCTDNAAMGAGCAYFYAKNKVFTPLSELKPFHYKNMQGKLCEY
ncbi:MAG: tRNA (adenosine(37)-N6)-threonylcarbamoyltransferase complex transferase subunit TsaD [Candidatus Cloacimonetes bacterium]|nr:tRNA (adenosine(37)-N6)-threonylcarbamoyltransferase complex transferase subunit TsaD [Candidatus Cloacimonadota bacterium]